MKKIIYTLLLSPVFAHGALSLKTIGQLTYAQIGQEMAAQAQQKRDALNAQIGDLQKIIKDSYKLKKVREDASRQLNNLIGQIITGQNQRDIIKMYLGAIYTAVQGTSAEARVRSILEYLDETDPVVLPKDLPMDKALQMGFAARL